MVTQFQITSLFSEGYGKAVTVSIAVSGFLSTGISPFNLDIFPEHLFSPAIPTDRPENVNDSTSTPITSSIQPPVEATAEPSTRSIEAMEGPLYVKPQKISPIPSASRSGERKRRAEVLQVLTSSPFVAVLKAKEAKKRAVEERRTAKRAKKQLHFDEGSEEDKNCDFEVGEDDSDAACIYCNDLFNRSKLKKCG